MQLFGLQISLPVNEVPMDIIMIIPLSNSREFLWNLLLLPWVRRLFPPPITLRGKTWTPGSSLNLRDRPKIT